MPALELAVLTRCEYAKPRKPAGKNTEHEMCDLARDMNRAMRVVEMKIELAVPIASAGTAGPHAPCPTQSGTSRCSVHVVWTCDPTPTDAD